MSREALDLETCSLHLQTTEHPPFKKKKKGKTLHVWHFSYCLNQLVVAALI